MIAGRKPSAAARTVSLLDGRTDLERPGHLGRDAEARSEKRVTRQTRTPGAWCTRGFDHINLRTGILVSSRQVGGRMQWIAIAAGKQVGAFDNAPAAFAFGEGVTEAVNALSVAICEAESLRDSEVDE